MPNRRIILQNILFLAIGAAAGIGGTAWVMSSGRNPDADEPRDTAGASGDGHRVDEKRVADTDWIEPADNFVRDIEGDCRISGRILDAEGRPQAGTRIFIRLLDEPWPRSHVPQNWISGPNGEFTSAGLACDIPMQAWAIDSQERRATVDRFFGNDTLDLTLEDGGSLVVKLDDNLDVGEIIYVLLAGDAMWPPRALSIPTPKSMTLRLRALPPGAYALVVSSQEGAFVSSELASVDAKKETHIEASFTPASVPHARLVDAETGAPVADAPVLLRGPIEMLQLVRRTDSDGEAVFPPLPRSLPISIEGLASGALSEVNRGTPAEDITAEIPPRAIVHGVVKTASGEPLSGVEVTAEVPHGDRSVEVTSASGQFFLSRMLDAAASGWPALIPLDTGYAPGPARIPTPMPVGEAVETSSAPERGLTDAEGRFELSMPRAARASLRARHPEYVVMRPTQISATDGIDLEPVTITMYQGLNVHVKASDEDDRPIPEAQVSAYGPDDVLLATKSTAPDGTVSLTGLPPNVRIEAEAPGRVPAFSSVFGRLGRMVETGIVLARADQVLKGRVLDSEGNPVSGASVTARSNQKGTLHVLVGVTDRSGAFSLPEAGSGYYRVVADAGEEGRAHMAAAKHSSDATLVLEKLPQPSASNTTWGTVDDLGVTDNRAKAPERPTAESPPGDYTENSFTTQYGSADQLVVTGPPPGRGGLPIELGPAKKKRGARVTGIRPGSQIAAAGLGVGDVIVSVDGKKVSGPAQARQAIEGAIGSVVMLEVESEGETFTVVVQRVRVSANDR